MGLVLSLLNADMVGVCRAAWGDERCDIKREPGAGFSCPGAGVANQVGAGRALCSGD